MALGVRVRGCPGQNSRIHQSVPCWDAIQVELWRADLATSVLELDASGNVLLAEDPAVAALFPPGRARGLGLGLHWISLRHLSHTVFHTLLTHACVTP